LWVVGVVVFAANDWYENIAVRIKRGQSHDDAVVVV